MTKKLGLVFALSLLAVFVTAGSALATTPPPTNTTPPAYAASAGYFHVGYTVTATGGTWSDAKATLKYQWQSCTDPAEPSTCSDIAKATSAAYKPLFTQVGSGLRVKVIATNKGGSSVPAYSDISAAVSTAGSTHSVDPGFADGSYFHVGYTIAATPGTWAAPKATFKYQWQSCVMMTCVDIARATTATYKLASTDNGKLIRVGVIATDAARVASISAYSATSPAVSTAGPANTEPPAISGYPHVGYSLTATPGTWAAPRSTFKYQWQSCIDPDDLSTCSDIAKATAATYKIVAGDVGDVIRVTVTATDLVKVSSDPVGSAVTAPAANDLPVSVSPPVVSGLVYVGQTLKATPGTWDAPSTSATYQWKRCISQTDTSTCTPIAKATASSYKLATADLGTYVRVAVTGINATRQASAAPAYSAAATSVANGEAPANTVAPSFVWGGDAPQVGDTIGASNGTWSGRPAPTSFTYQWLRCPATSTGVNAATGCSVIGGATNFYFTTVPADLAKRLRVRVTAANFVNSVSYVSSVSGVVGTPTAPVNTSAPTTSGDPFVGVTLHQQNIGDWSGTPTGYSRQWQACDEDLENPGQADLTACADIEGETTASYTVTEDDLGEFLRVGVKATNARGTSAFVYSVVTAAIDFAPPMLLVGHPPTVAEAGDGVLFASTGWWTNTDTWTRQWQVCDEDGEHPGAADLASCADIDSETGSFYTVQPGDVGKFLRVVVIGHNDHRDGAPATSAVTPKITATPVAPANLGTVTIDDTTPRVGDVLTTTDDGYSGTPSPTVAYQWYALDDEGLGHYPTEEDAIAGATGPTYTVQSSDLGLHLRVISTGSNTAGFTSTLSAPTVAVAAAPVAPTHEGSITIDNTTPTEGDVLTATDAVYTGDPTPSVTYLWFACDDAVSPVGCSAIEGATGLMLTVPNSAVGRYIRVSSTATNSAGADASTSAATAAVAAAG